MSPNPSIVMPVSRHLPVARLERSIAYYREVLGFRVGESDAAGAELLRPWGLRDFAVRDLEGNRITSAQPFE
jgi:hypothetical protein